MQISIGCSLWKKFIGDFRCTAASVDSLDIGRFPTVFLDFCEDVHVFVHCHLLLHFKEQFRAVAASLECDLDETLHTQVKVF